MEEVRARKQDEAAAAESLEQKRLRYETKERRAQIFFDEVMAEISEWQAALLEAKGQQRQMNARRESHKHRIQTSTLAALDSDKFTTRFHFAVCKPIGNFARVAMESAQVFVRNVCLEENANPTDVAFLGIIDYAGHGTHKDNLTEQLATTMSALPTMPYVVFYPETPSAEYKRVIALVASCRIASHVFGCCRLQCSRSHKVAALSLAKTAGASSPSATFASSAQAMFKLPCA